MPAMPMADSSAPMVVGARHTSRATSTTTVCVAPGVDGEGLQGHHHQQEDDGEPGQQDVEGDLVGRLLAVGPLDQGDHAVDEALAGLGGDPHDDAVGQHPGAAGDRRAVAARLADDRRRLAGDGRLVDRGDAFDDLAVTGDQLARAAHAPGRRRGGRDDGLSTVVPSAWRTWATVSRAGLAQRVGLGLAPAFGHGLGEVGEQHREPQPDGHRARRTRGLAVVALGRSTKNSTVVEHGADQHHEHDRVAGLGAGVELDERVDRAPGARWPARTVDAGLRSRRMPGSSSGSARAAVGG